MIYTKVRRFELARRVALLELLIVALMAGRSHAAVLPVPDTLTTRGSLKVSGTDHKATLLQNNQVQLAAGANFTMIAGAAYTPVGVASSSARQPLRIDTTSEGYRCSGGVCSFPNGNVGASYSAPITSTGGSGPTPYAWSVVAGSLPTGLSLTPSYGVYSAYVYGTPSSAATSTFTLQVRDGAGHTAQQAFTLTVNSAASLKITFPTSCCPNGTVGTSYLQNFFASGGVQPYTWSISAGQLPPGLSLSASAPASITGEPTTPGTFSLTVSVTDGAGSHADEQGSITIH